MPRKRKPKNPSLIDLAWRCNLFSTKWKNKFNKLARLVPNAIVTLHVNQTLQKLDLHIKDGAFQAWFNIYHLPKLCKPSFNYTRKTAYYSYKDKKYFKNMVEYFTPAVDKIKYEVRLRNGRY